MRRRRGGRWQGEHERAREEREKEWKNTEARRGARGMKLRGNERKQVVCLEIVDQGPDFQNFLRSKILEKS